MIAIFVYKFWFGNQLQKFFWAACPLIVILLGGPYKSGRILKFAKYVSVQRRYSDIADYDFGNLYMGDPYNFPRRLQVNISDKTSVCLHSFRWGIGARIRYQTNLCVCVANSKNFHGIWSTGKTIQKVVRPRSTCSFWEEVLLHWPH